MTTLIRIPAGHMRFVPTHRELYDMTTDLSPTKWTMEIVLIYNATGRETYLDHSWVHMILSPAIEDICMPHDQGTN